MYGEKLKTCLSHEDKISTWEKTDKDMDLKEVYSYCPKSEEQNSHLKHLNKEGGLTRNRYEEMNSTYVESHKEDASIYAQPYSPN